MPTKHLSESGSTGRGADEPVGEELVTSYEWVLESQHLPLSLLVYTCSLLLSVFSPLRGVFTADVLG